MTATQTIVETNSPASPDCPLTGKIGNNYIKTDTGLFYQVPGFTGTTNKIADWREHLLPGLPPRCAHNPMTFRVNFSPNIMAVIKPPPSLSRSNCSTSTNQRCKTPVLLWASHTNTTKDGDNIMRAGDNRMSCWQPVVLRSGSLSSCTTPSSHLLARRGPGAAGRADEVQDAVSCALCWALWPGCNTDDSTGPGGSRFCERVWINSSVRGFLLGWKL